LNDGIPRSNLLWYKNESNHSKEIHLSVGKSRFYSSIFQI
jgi:hypothetical protein